MKNILLTTALIITFFKFTIAQNVNILDTNFKAFLVGDLSINTNGDTEIQISEAASYSGGIACDMMNITDLTGIEEFTSLTWLECFANQLTSLDVSQNTSLTYLLCHNNQLTNLNVNGANSLTLLNCNHNQLSSLDLSGNTAMIELDCSNNQIHNLNLSNCTNLNYLICNVNDLSNLDMTENTQLLFLDCSYNQLPTLNISQNTLLDGLICSSNQLTFLDVSHNTLLEGLNCEQNILTNLDVSLNLGLKFLDCRNNQINILDVTQNSSLIDLYCQNNQLNRLDVRNDNNINMNNFYTTNNSGLLCIQVDDSSYSNANWDNVDPWSLFSTNCNYASIEKSKLANLVSFFPNPTINTIKLEVDKSLIGSFYAFYNNTGKLILNGIINTENTVLDMANLSKGINLLCVGDNLEHKYKIVKE